MNVTIDTLEIRSVELPPSSVAIGAALVVAMVIYIVASLATLFKQCYSHPAKGRYTSAANDASYLDETL